MGKIAKIQFSIRFDTIPLAHHSQLPNFDKNGPKIKKKQIAMEMPQNI